MKLLIAFCFVALVGLSLAGTKTHHRGCIYILGRCSRECDIGTHAFATACGYLTPEATCDNPKPETDYGGKICDYSACYCDPPTVRDTTTRKCVPLEECPKKEVENKEVVNKEVENKEVGNKELENKEVENKEVENKEVGNKELENKEVENKEVENKEVESKEVVNKEVVNKEVVNKEVDSTEEKKF